MEKQEERKHADKILSPGVKPILRVEKTSKDFSGFKALTDVSFEVQTNEIFGIAGPNGAGKSTLFNVIAGKESNQGDIFFRKKNIARFRPYKVCHMGIARTFQTPELFLSMNVYDNINVGARFGLSEKHEKQNADKIMDEVIELVGLTASKNVSAGSLDLFEKKLTTLALALVTKPRLLLLDEPLGGLSPHEIDKFVKLILHVRDELNLTVIIIEHLMNVLAEICNTLMILNSGAKICIGPPDEVLNNKEVIKVYLGEKNVKS
ncbi:MAG: ABC transporter ATP-binding protein [Desulfobacterales bacterium]|nr:ABC transporter ATP-binding protein [Desulfobacterales bacterium]